MERTRTRWISSMNTPGFGGTRAQEDIEYGCSSYRRNSFLHKRKWVSKRFAEKFVNATTRLDTQIYHKDNNYCPCHMVARIV